MQAPDALPQSWIQRRSAARPPLLLVAISVAITLLLLLPVVYLLLRASQVGPRAWEMAFTPRTLRVLGNSVLLVLLVTIFSAAIGVPLAWLTARSDLPGRKMWSLLTTLPLVIPSYVGGFALIAFMGPRGMLQEWLAPFGVERLPSIYGLVGAVWALTLFTYPYLLLSVRAGLRRADPSLEEAARSLGKSAWQTFWQVTLPNQRPAIAAGALLVALYTLSDFGAVSLLRFNSFTRVIYLQYRGSFDRSLAAVLALLLAAMTILILIGERRSEGRARFYRLGAGAGRLARPLPLGRWKLPALAFTFGVTMAALVIPLLVILIWLWRGVTAGESFAPLGGMAWRSMQAALLAAGAATLAALPVAYLAVRFPGRLGLLCERAAYIGYGLPGIVVALSLVFFGANYLLPLYQTLPMLVFAYVVLFLPQALGAIRAGLLQSSPRLEEAARGLGLRPRLVLLRVTLPLLRPGLWTGAALVFLTTIKELPATLLLAPSGFDTLATRIWSAAEEAFFARAAAPALLLVLISAFSIFILLSQEERGAA